MEQKYQKQAQQELTLAKALKNSFDLIDEKSIQVIYFSIYIIN